jgi:phage-related minor tail protein
MPYVEVYLEPSEVLREIDTEDLIEELESRGSNMNSQNSINSLIQKIYELRRTGQNYDAVLDELIYNTIGRI